MEAGLEIVAKRRGKNADRPPRLSLRPAVSRRDPRWRDLRGVLTTRRRGVCVLDEVDAPLDGHNAARLLDALLHGADRSKRYALHHHHP